MKLRFNPKDQPVDFCPRGHGPMWWTPGDGTWACQNVHCGETEPTVYYRTDTAQRVTHSWMAGQRLSAPLVMHPQLFTINGMGA